MTKKRALIVGNEESAEQFSQGLKKGGYDAYQTPSGKLALDRLEREVFDVVVSDLRLSDISGIEFIRKAKSKSPALLIISLATAGAEAALDAIKAGAHDCLAKPISVDDLLLAIRKAVEREGEIPRVKGMDPRKEHVFSNIVAKSSNMVEIFTTIKKISDYKTTCLLQGESGTGKELIARAIHYNSSRAEKPFVTVNCGAIPENLLESELFGHMKGSFTGAIRTKKGLFEEADTGTLFLDEIGELPLLLQVKILRALQEEEIRRVGDVTPIKVDVRIIAATVKDLVKGVENGTFREDLFYRLHVLPIYVPPLRERKEDVTILVNYFLQKYNRKLSTQVKVVDPQALKVLLDYDWPGNVRELENAIERAMVLVTTDRIYVDNLPNNVRETQRTVAGGGIRVETNELSIKKLTRLMEEDLILRALQRSMGNRTKAAKLLEISHRALLYKIKQYKLEGKISNLKRKPDE